MLKQFLELAQDLIAPGVVHDRRVPVRLACQAEVEVVAEGVRHLTKVVDISPKGLRLEGPGQLSKGQSIEIRNPRVAGKAVSAQVVWSRGNTAGALFTETGAALAGSWVRGQLLESGFDAEKRNQRRSFIRFPAPSLQTFLIDGQGELLAEGRMVNVGHGGALVALATQVATDIGVRIRVEETPETPALDTLAAVRSFHKSPKKFFVTGLQFGNPGEAQVKRFVRAVRKKMGVV